MTPSTQVSESPFPDQFMSFIDKESETEEEQPTYYNFEQLDSPFQSIYELESEEGIVDPETEEIMEFLDELYDEEFDEAIYELINEAEDLYQDRFESEYSGNPIAQKIEAQRVLEAHFVPLVKEIEGFLEGMSEEVEKLDFDTMSDTNLRSKA